MVPLLVIWCSFSPSLAASLARISFVVLDLHDLDFIERALAICFFWLQDAPVGSFVIKLTATDADEIKELIYKIVDGNIVSMSYRHLLNNTNEIVQKLCFMLWKNSVSDPASSKVTFLIMCL